MNLRTIFFVIAAAVSLGVQLALIPIVGMGPGFEAVSIGRSLALHGTFSDPFDEPTGPTAHLAPVYPLLLAGVYRLTPDEEHFRVVMLGLTLLAHLLNVWLLFRLARELFRDPWIARVALGLGLVAPLYQVIPTWESIWLSCGAMGFWLLARRRRVVVSGVFGGLLLLLNPAMIFVVLPVAIYEWKQVKLVSEFALILLVVITPWELRNYGVFHELFFVRDNLGLELDVYNNDCETYGTAGCAPHPVSSAAERTAIRGMGEAAYNQMRMGRALAWIGSHAGGELGLILRRAITFWFPVSAHAPFGWSITVLTAVSLWGFRLMWHDRATAVAPMIAISVLYPLVYYLVRFDLRYRYPILWIAVIASAYAITAETARLRACLRAGPGPCGRGESPIPAHRGRSSPPDPPR